LPLRKRHRGQPTAWTLSLLQEPPQPKPDVPIEMGQLLRRVHNREVGPPTHDDPVESPHQFAEVHPQAGSLGLLTDFLAYRLHRLLAGPRVGHQATGPSRWPFVKMESEEVEAVALQVNHVGLPGMQGQPQSSQKPRDQLAHLLRRPAAAADHHEIVAVAIELAEARVTITPPPIER